MNPQKQLLIVLGLLAFQVGCQSRADMFIAHMDAQPPEKRPHGWENVKRLMARTAPAAGEAAPDFTLSPPDGGEPITRSAFQGDKPLVMIFGSFT